MEYQGFEALVKIATGDVSEGELQRKVGAIVKEWCLVWHGIWYGGQYLSTHAGPLLDRLRDPVYFARFFVDAGALCWPNGLELSPARLHALVEITAAA